MNIGIFGGSFDPIHIGHLILAQDFVELCNLDKCFFVPAYISPLKEANIELTNAGIRKELIRLAIEGNSIFELDEFELQRKKISYTIETLEYFDKRYSEDQLFLLIGSDQALNFGKWKDWQRIVELAKLVIALRPEDGINILKIREILLEKPFQSLLLDSPVMQISSSDIRNRIRLGKPYKYLLNDLVWQAIERAGYYK